jgi:hypothetical protein
VCGGGKKKLLLSESAGGIQCILFFLGVETFPRKEKNMENSWFGFF